MVKINKLRLILFFVWSSLFFSCASNLDMTKRDKKVNDYKDKIRKTKTLYAKEDSKLFAKYKNELQN